MSPCYEVSVMVNLAARDIRSITGSNMRLLVESTGLNPWEFGGRRFKEELLKMEKVAIPEADCWRIRYLAELLEQRQESFYQANEEGLQRLSLLIDSLCIN